MTSVILLYVHLTFWKCKPKGQKSLNGAMSSRRRLTTRDTRTVLGIVAELISVKICFKYATYILKLCKDAC